MVQSSKVIKLIMQLRGIACSKAIYSKSFLELSNYDVDKHYYVGPNPMFDYPSVTTTLNNNCITFDAKNVSFSTPIRNKMLMQESLLSVLVVRSLSNSLKGSILLLQLLGPIFFQHILLLEPPFIQLCLTPQ